MIGQCARIAARTGDDAVRNDCRCDSFYHEDGNSDFGRWLRLRGPSAVSLGAVSQSYSPLPGWLGGDGQARAPAHEQMEGRFDYVIADFSKPGWSRAIQGSFDVIVSTIAIHNVRVPGIIEGIYKEVFELLKPGGCFLNLDLVFVPLAKQLGWLRTAGFSEVRSYWQEGREALFGGRKI